MELARSRTRTLLVATLAVCGPLGLTGLVWNRIDRVYVPVVTESAPFDRSKWVKGRAPDRMSMVRFVIDRKALHGIERGSVIGLLEPPDKYDSINNVYSWFVGYEAGGLFDELVWFDVGFSPDGKVIYTGTHVTWN